VANELIFYTNPMSRGRVVRWMLEEVGQPYRTEILDYPTAMKAPEYLAINPMGKVPALKHGDAVITETAAICAYLADAFPAARLAPPPGDRLRGAYYRWLFFAAGPLEAAWTNQVLGVAIPEDKERMVGYGNFATVLDVLENLLSGCQYVAGDTFTAADLYLGAQLWFGTSFGMIEKRPTFMQYVGRLTGRAAFARAQELDGPPR
jgi:glutathione S-transferase